MSLEKKEYIIYGNYNRFFDKDTIVINYIGGNLEYIINNIRYDYKQFFKIKFSSKNKIFFKFDFSGEDVSFMKADYIIKQIKKIEKTVRKVKIGVGITENEKTILANVIKGKSDYELNILTSIGVLLFDKYEDRCEFIYDEACKYLDGVVVDRNLCGFRNDKCIVKRHTDCTIGCCNHLKNVYLGVLYQRKLYTCKYLVDKKCTAQCLTCKMHMCDYVIKKTGIKFTTRNVLPVKHYFNPIQKLILKVDYFTPKEKTLKKLMLANIFEIIYYMNIEMGKNI